MGAPPPSFSPKKVCGWQLSEPHTSQASACLTRSDTLKPLIRHSRRIEVAGCNYPSSPFSPQHQCAGGAPERERAFPENSLGKPHRHRHSPSPPRNPQTAASHLRAQVHRRRQDGGLRHARRARPGRAPRCSLLRAFLAFRFSKFLAVVRVLSWLLPCMKRVSGRCHGTCVSLCRCCPA
jgi:hypothetical protein